MPLTWRWIAITSQGWRWHTQVAGISSSYSTWNEMKSLISSVHHLVSLPAFFFLLTLHLSR